MHRIGRTARAERDGIAITLVNPEDIYRFSQIERFLEKELAKTPLPDGLGEAPEYKVSTRHSGAPKGRGRGGRRQHGKYRSQAKGKTNAKGSADVKSKNRNRGQKRNRNKAKDKSKQ